MLASRKFLRKHKDGSPGLTQVTVPFFSYILLFVSGVQTLPLTAQTYFVQAASHSIFSSPIFAWIVLLRMASNTLDGIAGYLQLGCNVHRIFPLYEALIAASVLGTPMKHGYTYPIIGMTAFQIQLWLSL